MPSTPCVRLAVLALIDVSIAAAPAWCDPPTPKVCVALVGDPDDAARASARTLEQAVAARGEFRAVADDASRAALRGEPGSESTDPQLAADRRALDGTDRDARGLNAIGDRLGCSLVAEIIPRPGDTVIRAYDVVHHSFRGRMSVGAVDASLIDRFVLEPARGSVEPDAPVVAAAPAPAAPVVGAHPAALQTLPRTSASAPAPPTARSVTAANATPPNAPAHRPSGIGVWLPWVIVGAAAAALITVIVVSQNTGPAIPVIHVEHPGSTASASP